MVGPPNNEKINFLAPPCGIVYNKRLQLLKNLKEHLGRLTCQPVAAFTTRSHVARHQTQPMPGTQEPICRPLMWLVGMWL